MSLAPVSQAWSASAVIEQLQNLYSCRPMKTGLQTGKGGNKMLTLLILWQRDVLVPCSLEI